MHNLDSSHALITMSVVGKLSVLCIHGSLLLEGFVIQLQLQLLSYAERSVQPFQ